jgi:outer membrane protein assembly factor BamB
VRRVLLTVLLPATLVAACSSSNGSSGAPTSPASTTSSAATTSTTGATASSSTPTTAVTSTTAAPADASWLTFGASSDRRGAVAAGPDPGGIAQAWATDQLDGALYGEPVVAGGRVVVATEHDSVYAFDVATGQAAWNVNLGDPIPRSALECGNIDPTGITGTPVIDAGTGTVYVVAFVQPGRHDLVALNMTDGSIRWRRPADPPGLDPFHEQQRSALTIGNGRVYVAYGGLFGDCGPYKGAVVSIALDGMGDPQSWIVPTSREGGLWAPSGLTIDTNGNLFVSTGNAASTDPNNFDDGNAVVRLTPDLHAVDVWAPSDWYTLSARDADLGSIGPLPLGGGRIFVSGKNGVGYVLDGTQLGGVGGELSNTRICNGGAFGGSATNGSVVVVGCSSGPVGLEIGNDATITPRWQGPNGRSGAPIIAGGSVWLVNNNGHLYALDAASGTVQADVDLQGRISGFPTPTVLPTTVLVPAGSRLIAFAS